MGSKVGDGITKALRRRGIRATKNRVAVARILDGAGRPMGIKEIYSKLSDEEGNVGMATVYRVMSVLEEAGLVQRQPFVSGKSALYSVPAAAAGQVVCSKCGKVEDIDQLPGLERLREEVAQRSDFATPEQSLYIIADCRNEECG